jgi:riboflavin kinase/FMN adenylyltransferase
MRRIEGLDAVLDLSRDAQDNADTPQDSVVAVGVFDGVHLGHQRLLHELLELGSALRAVPSVITFRNHPDQILRGSSPPLLVSVPHRLRLLRRAGVQRLALLDFEPRLQQMTAREFAERVLVGALHTKGLLLGYDSALGKDREGTPERFRELGAELGFQVRTGEPFLVDGTTVSSTKVRDVITRGDLLMAQRFLGRLPSTFGEVVHGEARGRALGFPTANIVPQTPVLPPNGVYVVQVILDSGVLKGVANLGTRPTFAGTGTVLEVHLLDFQGDLYGRELEIAFLARLRGEQKFSNLDALKTQITNDIAAARLRLRS